MSRTTMFMSRPLLAGAVLAVLAAGVANDALAGQFNAAAIGQALPSWVDSFPRINNAGDVSWSEQGAGDAYAKARLYSTSAPIGLHQGAIGTQLLSFATDISERLPNNDVWVAGSVANHPALLDQRAIAWRANAGSGAVPQIVDLSLAFDEADSHEQTRALAVHAPASGAGTILVGGSARVRVERANLPKPVLWAFSGAGETGATADYNFLPIAAGENGVVVDLDVNAAGTSGWACGNVGAAAPNAGYARATCWPIDATTGIANGARVDVLDAAGQSAGVATSIVNRVRTLPIGTGGALETVVVGAAMMTEGSRWTGWVYNLTTQEFIAQIGLQSNADAMAFDVSELLYTRSDDSVFSRGLMVGGMSSTLATSTVGHPAGQGPLDPVPAALRGVTHRTLLHGVGVSATGQSCDINDDSSPLSSSSGDYNQIIGLSDGGRYRIARVDDQLVRLMAMFTHTNVEIRVRDTRVRTSAAQGQVTGPSSGGQQFRYHQVQAPGTSNAVLRLSNALGCDQPEHSGSALCGAMVPAAFEIGTTNVLDIPLSRVGTTNLVRSAIINGVINAADYNFAQLASGSSASCDITPVFPAAVVTNPPQDFDGRNWLECIAAIPGHDTDPLIAFDHCGACGVQTDDGRLCTSDSCVNGERRYGASGQGCWINGSATAYQSGTCYVENERNPNPTTNAYHIVTGTGGNCGGTITTPNVQDPCSVCKSANPTNWSTSTNATCCPGGAMRLDVYDRAQLDGCDASTGISYDRNDGRVRRARWKDPRSQWIYDQRDDWSNQDGTECYAEGSGDPQVALANLSSVNGSYVRPRRIDAFFTWPVDTEDWYEASFDDDGDGQPTPKPRARLISRDINPNTGRPVKMQLCLYVDGANGGRSRVDIKDMRANRGVEKGATHDGPWNSPAYDARGQCVNTDNAGRADIVVYDYDITDTRKEDAYVHFVVRPLDDISRLHCDGTDYTLYFGNDKRAGTSPETGYHAGRTGCLDCCD